MKPLDKIDFTKVVECLTKMKDAGLGKGLKNKEKKDAPDVVIILDAPQEDLIKQFTDIVEGMAHAGSPDKIPVEAIPLYNDIYETATKDSGAKAKPAKTAKEPKPPKPAKEPKPPKEKKEPKKVEKSRYGHIVGSQAAKIDDMLFEGITIKAAAEKLGVKNARIISHIMEIAEKSTDTILYAE